jgi:BirA family transcriptional regulator, biotin operon repressor / biotin---[acetyl-CoA-carboxylase] ligase
MAENCPNREYLLELLAREIRHRRQTVPQVDAELVVRYGLQVGIRIDCHAELPRAMEHAREHIAEEEKRSRSVVSGTVILADTMQRSRGRFDRIWYAPPGGVWGCLVHANTLLSSSRRFLPFAVGVACCEAIRSLGLAGASIRWVNDILIDGKKIAGFLAESFTSLRYHEEYDLVGFGINVNNTSFPADLSAMATSLSEVLGHRIDLSSFTALFLAKLAWNVGLLYYEEARNLRGDGFSGQDGRHLLLESWAHLSDSIGQRVIFGFDVMNTPQYEANVVTMDDDGGLVLQHADGWQKVEYSGEIRYVRGIRE